ncbi:RNaseH domain-containing protein [Saccharothrix ecbatanensis]|uniref:RNaseH domain-containing protein n=1 Tax=Saccharothrix ecbatanensis TaxID=1105145 RepID=UPI00160985CB
MRNGHANGTAERARRGPLQQEGDDPAAWAAYAHQQRHTASHFPDPLVLPGVLHLAHKVSEYLLPPHERELLLDPEG